MILIKPAYDADASAYFTTAGVTSTAGRQQVSRFVTGIKDLGLWNNMVCWPLRSSQNAGTGTTAYSLGGLGTFNGTLTNGPSWGTDEITFDGSNDYIATSLATQFSDFFCIAVFFPNDAATFARVVDKKYDTGFWIGRSGNGAVSQFGGGVRESSDPFGRFVSLTNRQRHFLATTRSSATHTIFANGNQLTASGTVSSAQMSSENLAFGYDPTLGGAYKGGISFVMIANVSLSQSNSASIYSLYKSTLGQGLGLP